MRVPCRSVCLALALGGWLTAVGRGSDLQSIFAARDWFKLRRAVDSPQAGDFYKGAVASAFHKVRDAETLLGRVIKLGGDPRLALQAHGLLAYMYMRTGQYRDTYAHLSAMHRIDPDYSGLKGALVLFSALSKLPELKVQRQRPSQVRMTNDFFIPLSVNGKPAAYGFDTGANLSLMSEAEATRLGLHIHEATGSEYRDGASGNAVPIRFVIVDRVTLGSFELRNVAFLLIAEGALPFRELPRDKQGILGLPPLFAFRTIGWDKERILRLGFPSTLERTPNLCFDAAIPVVEGSHAGRPINGWLDTGNSTTYLTPRFLGDFRPAGAANGVRRKTVLRGVGGETDVEVVQLPEARFTLGGADLVLRPASVLPEQQSVDRNAYHVWLGMDLLSRRKVLIDFRSMSMTVGRASD